MNANVEPHEFQKELDELDDTTGARVLIQYEKLVNPRMAKPERLALLHQLVKEAKVGPDDPAAERAVMAVYAPPGKQGPRVYPVVEGRPDLAEMASSDPWKVRDLWKQFPGAPYAIATAGGPSVAEKAKAEAEAKVLERFSSIATEGRAFLKREIPKPASLLGDGIAAGSQVGTLVGVAGYGKSWLLLHLARAWARGEPFFGLWVPAEGIRVGVLELEDHAHSWQSRLRKLVGDEPDEKDDRIELVTKPELKGPVDLRDPGTVKALVHWIRDRKLGALIVDSLKHAHMGNENDNEHMHWVMSGLTAIADETGAAVLAGHHESPKETMTGRQRSIQAAGRGASTIYDDSRFQFVLRRHPSGLRCLSASKVSQGPDVEDIWLKQTEGGPFELGQDPGSVGADNREKVRLALVAAPDGITRDELEQQTGLKKATVKKHLASLGALPSLDSKPKWTLPPATAATAATHHPIAGDDAIQDNVLPFHRR